MKLTRKRLRELILEEVSDEARARSLLIKKYFPQIARYHAIVLALVDAYEDGEDELVIPLKGPDQLFSPGLLQKGPGGAVRFPTPNLDLYEIQILLKAVGAKMPYVGKELTTEFDIDYKLIGVGELEHKMKKKVNEADKDHMYRYSPSGELIPSDQIQSASPDLGEPLSHGGRISPEKGTDTDPVQGWDDDGSADAAAVIQTDKPAGVPLKQVFKTVEDMILAIADSDLSDEYEKVFNAVVHQDYNPYESKTHSFDERYEPISESRVDLARWNLLAGIPQKKRN